jgi:hypothetical protein
MNKRGEPHALLTDGGKPLVRYWMEGGKMKRYDFISKDWALLPKKIRPHGMKHLRKTSASMLAKHKDFKFYIPYFLSHSPETIADKNYFEPSKEEFFEALEWLRKELIG